MINPIEGATPSLVPKLAPDCDAHRLQAGAGADPDPADRPVALARRGWMAVLARASTRELEQALQVVLAGTARGDGPGDADASPAQTWPWPAFDWLRAPETGLAMVRGRVGGTGDPFNLGETTVTRATLRLQVLDGCVTIGVAWHLGRDKRRAECAALLDALLQIPARHDAVQACVIKPLAARQAEQRDVRNRAAAATKVEFFTMVRGE